MWWQREEVKTNMGTSVCRSITPSFCTTFLRWSHRHTLSTLANPFSYSTGNPFFSDGRGSEEQSTQWFKSSFPRPQAAQGERPKESV